MFLTKEFHVVKLNGAGSTGGRRYYHDLDIIMNDIIIIYYYYVGEFTS